MIFSVPDFCFGPMPNFAQRLRDLRSAGKLTQTRFAKLHVLSPHVYSRWETGDLTEQVDTIVRIAKLLEVPLDDLAGRNHQRDGFTRKPCRRMMAG